MNFKIETNNSFGKIISIMILLKVIIFFSSCSDGPVKPIHDPNALE
jgi:hypothetical protein